MCLAGRFSFLVRLSRCGRGGPRSCCAYHFGRGVGRDCVFGGSAAIDAGLSELVKKYALVPRSGWRACGSKWLFCSVGMKI